ncbi:MAG TPA: hypothetical protein VF170_07090 [Planctomycetaceae bacterium]
MTRVVLLGASNVTLGFGVITRLIRAGFDGPLDVRAALGHGRSYGAWSTVAVRSLPGIAESGLWASLGHAETARTYALLTDVGNDLMYGFPPERIAGWVETCLDRLADGGAAVVVTRLPIARVERLSAARYHATRMSFFPLHRPVSWTEMLRRARDLDALVAEAALRRGAAVVTPPLEWYGFDPIHIRWTRRPRAWAEILSAWPGFRRPSGRVTAPALPLIGRFPERYRLFGRDASSRQPVTVRDDATLSLY